VFAFGTMGTGLEDVDDAIATGVGINDQRGFNFDRGPDTVALVSKGCVTLSNGTVNGDIYYGTTYSAPNVTINAGTVHGPVASPIDFTDAQTKLIAMSQAFAGYPTNGTVKSSNGNLTLTGTDPELNVLQTPQNSGLFYSFTLNVPSGSSTIINWLDQSPEIANAGFTGFVPNTTLWNFPDASRVTIMSVGFPGQVLAPNASVYLDNCKVTGTVVANSVYPSSAELYSGTYNVPICSGCVCKDLSWSCSGNITLDDWGHAYDLVPEAAMRITQTVG